MAQRSEKAQERVREALQRNPDATTQELQEAAASVEASVSELSRRQFNAGYVLPLKRAASAGRKKAARGGRKRQVGRRREAAVEPAPATEAAPPQENRRAAGESERDAVRATLLQFARDFSAAESRTDIVGVLADVDRYVDRIVDARG